MIPLLILRPEPGASATAKRARALGLTALVRPLFMVAPMPWDAPDPARFDAVLLTSAAAIRAGGDAVQRYRDLRVFAVGAATAQAARDAGFRTVTPGAGDAADMVRQLANLGYCRPLHLSGEDRTPYPDGPVTITPCVVYAARPVDVDLPSGRCTALLHSVRAGARFAMLCPSRAQVDIVAISNAVAEAAGPGWRSTATAPQPQDNAMLALAAALCDGTALPTGRT